MYIKKIWKNVSDKKINYFYYYVNVVTESRTGLQIYEGRDDQLNRPGAMA
jgi:hypothetical protein